MSSHEPLNSHRSVHAGSNRSFGLTFSILFLILAVFPWVRHGDQIRIWALCVSALFALVALLAANLLSPLNKLWFKFGLAIHNVVSPIIMGILFYFVVTPAAISLRILGKDPLRMKWDESHSYWIKREPSGPQVGAMKNQY